MPVLVVNGEEVGQTRAIIRYVGKLAGLYPTNPAHALRCDEILDFFEEMIPDAFKETDESRETYFSEEGKTGYARLQKLEAFIQKGHGVIGGASLTVADVVIFSYTCMIPALAAAGFLKGVPSNIFDNFPSIQSVRKAVASHPKVVAYYKTAKHGFAPMYAACREL